MGATCPHCSKDVAGWVPEDRLSKMAADKREALSQLDTLKAEAEALKKFYGLDVGFGLRYIRWITKFVRGNMGYSYEWEQPVFKLLKERLPFTILLSLSTLIFTYIVAVPIGIYSATHQYSVLDYVFSLFGFVGLATPNFMLALILILWAIA